MFEAKCEKCGGRLTLDDKVLTLAGVATACLCRPCRRAFDAWADISAEARNVFVAEARMQAAICGGLIRETETEADALVAARRVLRVSVLAWIATAPE